MSWAKSRARSPGPSRLRNGVGSVAGLPATTSCGTGCTRHGKQNGTRAMMAVLALGREFGQDRLRTAVASAVSHGACDVAAARYLLTGAGLQKARPEPVDVGVLALYDRPMPSLADYDTLLVSTPCAGTA